MNEQYKRYLKFGAYFAIGFIIMFAFIKVYTYFFLTEVQIDVSSVDNIAYLKGQPTPYTGKYKVFYPGTHTKQETGFFTNGKRNGEFLTYHSNGNINVQVKYVNGAKDGMFTISNIDGVVINKINYVLWKREWKAEYFYDTGELESVEVFKDDAIEWTKKVFYKDGKTKAEMEYKNDRKQGTEKMYTPDGALFQNFSYSGSVFIKGKVFYEDTGKLKTELVFDPATGAMRTTEYDKNGKAIGGTPAVSATPLPLPVDGVLPAPLLVPTSTGIIAPIDTITGTLDER